MIDSLSKEEISKQKSIDLLQKLVLLTHAKDFKELWNSLPIEEKFVLADFATDHFINYKNRYYLLKLMRRGIVHVDPLTGRLKVMSHTFRGFVIEYNLKHPEEFINSEKYNDVKVFQSWKIPIIIVGVGGFLLVVYLYKESFNEFLLIGGSLLSTLGLIAKFVDVYKKK